MTLNCRSYPRRDEREREGEGGRERLAESYPIHLDISPDPMTVKIVARFEFSRRVGRNANDLGHRVEERKEERRAVSGYRKEVEAGKKGPKRIRTWKGKGERVRGSGRKLKSGGPRSH